MEWTNHRLYIRVAEELAAQNLPATCTCHRSIDDCMFCILYAKWTDFYEQNKEIHGQA